MVTVWSPVRDTETERMKDEERAWPFHRNGFQQDCEVCAELGHLFSGVRLWGAASQPGDDTVSIWTMASPCLQRPMLEPPGWGKRAKKVFLPSQSPANSWGRIFVNPHLFCRGQSRKSTALHHWSTRMCAHFTKTRSAAGEIELICNQSSVFKEF